MQQKVAVACAIVADPPIILLDEPTLGLDVQAARIVKQWVRQLAEQDGKTVLLTTHQLDMAQELCDRVAIMNGGRLLADKPVDELLGLFREDHYQIRLGGRVDGQQDAFGGLAVTEAGGDTILSGPLLGRKSCTRSSGRFIAWGFRSSRSVAPGPDLEEAFVRMLEEET